MKGRGRREAGGAGGGLIQAPPQVNCALLAALANAPDSSSGTGSCGMATRQDAGMLMGVVEGWVQPKWQSFGCRTGGGGALPRHPRLAALCEPVAGVLCLPYLSQSSGARPGPNSGPNSDTSGTHLGLVLALHTCLRDCDGCERFRTGSG